MLYFKSKTAEQLAALHNEAFKESSKSTKTTFLQSLKRVERIYGKKFLDMGLDFVDKPQEFLIELDNSKYSENTKLTTLTCILKLLKLIDAPLVVYNQWLTILKEKTEERQKSDDENLQKRLKVLMDFKTIKLHVYDRANHFIKGDVTLQDFKNFLILALFTIQIPVRISNYVSMKVVDDDVFVDDTGNFLVVNDNTYKFVFNKYRTSHILGKKELFVTEKTLQYLIDRWLSEFNKDSPNFLIINEKNKRPMNGKQIEQSIKDASSNIFTYPLTIDNIRASYMKRIVDLDPNFQDKLDICNILGYSTSSILDKHSSDEVKEV